MATARATFRKRFEELFTSGRIASARELARVHTQSDPGHAHGWALLADAMTAMGQYKGAVDVLRKVKRLLAPEHLHRVHFRCGHIRQQAGDYRGAERWYRKAIDGQPDDSDYWVFLGGMMLTAGRHRDAEAVLRRATKCKRGCIEEAYLNLGYVLRGLGLYEQARTAFRRAIARDGSYAEAKVALGDMRQVRRSGSAS
jgi:tetratricopeptide (TPR) repeat protein